MKKKSQIKSGFTLLETIISITITMILLVGVFNVYMILIKDTKNGEIKQRAALIGKQLVEKIKDSSNDVIANDGKTYLSEDVAIDEDSKQGRLKIKKNGSITDGEDYEYEADINLSEKTVEGNDDNSTNFINISSYDGDEQELFIIGDNTIYSSDNCPLKEKKDFNITSNLEINIDKNGNGTIGFDGKETKNTDSMNIALDMNYCASKVKIDVINNSHNTLNLCILNSTYISNGERNVEINNKKGPLNEYYRSSFKDKSGTLYNISIDVYKKGNREKKLFHSTFVKNLKIN